MIERVQILPGGMNSDKAITTLGATEHQDVVNLRMTKEGEWDTVQGYELVMQQFTNVKAAMEFTDDRAPSTADRFILFQDGTALYRIDYLDTPGPGQVAGYVNGAVTLLLSDSLKPDGLSDVSIANTSTLRFYYHNGVIRITGATVPLWYSYLDRTLFPGSVVGAPVSISGFYLLKAALDPTAITVKGHINEIGDSASNSDYTADDNKEFTLHYFLVYDNSQYSLLTPLLGYADDAQLFVRSASYLAALELRIYGSAIGWDNARVTGVGIVSKEASSGTYNVLDVIYFDAELEQITYTAISVDLEDDDMGSKKKIKWDNTQSLNGNHSQYEGYLYDGLPITVKEAGSDYDELDTEVASVVWAASGDGISYLLTTDVIPSGIIHDEIAILVMERNWRFGGTSPDYYFSVNIGINLNNADEYHEFVDIPAGTTSINPNFSHFLIAANRGYIVSMESGEEDIIRYSPEYQFDVFPNINLIATQVGDRDTIMAITARDDRVMIMKGRSISQGQFAGSGYSQDIGFFQRGLYAVNGNIVIDNVLYWMDQDQIWAFDGSEPIPMLQVGYVKESYKLYISTTSFFVYDKINNELWAVLNGAILVYQFSRKEWFKRSTDIAIKGGYLDFRNHLIAFTSAGLYDFNSTTHEETLTFSFKTRLEQIGNPAFYKRLDTIQLQIKCSGAVTITVKDPNDARTYTADIIPDNAVVDVSELFPDYLFREVDINIALKTAATSAAATIRGMDLLIERWH